MPAEAKEPATPACSDLTDGVERPHVPLGRGTPGPSRPRIPYALPWGHLSFLPSPQGQNVFAHLTPLAPGSGSAGTTGIDIAAWLVGEVLMRAVLLGALVALLVIQARAAENVASAASMLPYCRASLSDSTGTFIQGFCAGIVVGVAALAQPLFAPGQSRSTERCIDIPKNMSSGQLIQAVVHYIEARPQRKNEQFTIMTLEALFDTWPCRPSPAKPNDAPGPAPPIGSGHFETTHRRRRRHGMQAGQHRHWRIARTP
jgi:Rap1a immunity proteins